MSRIVRVKAGVKGIALPDGNVYDGQVDVTLTDAEFARIRSALFPGTLTDLGHVADPGVDADFVSEAELASIEAGRELGYAERTNSFTTTNTVLWATTSGGAAGAKIGGLSVTIVGTGRPVDIKFYCGACSMPTAALDIAAYLLVNGVGDQIGIVGSAANSSARSMVIERRLLLTLGVSYTFEVGVSGSAGTKTFDATAQYPLSLSLTSR